MKERQKRFFEQLAGFQEECVQACLARHCGIGNSEGLLYEVTYEMAVRMLELLDGYSGFSSNRQFVVDSVTREVLQDHLDSELHDMVEKYLKYE